MRVSHSVFPHKLPQYVTSILIPDFGFQEWRFFGSWQTQKAISCHTIRIIIFSYAEVLLPLSVNITVSFTCDRIQREFEDKVTNKTLLANLDSWTKSFYCFSFSVLTIYLQCATKISAPSECFCMCLSCWSLLLWYYPCAFNWCWCQSRPWLDHLLKKNACSCKFMESNWTNRYSTWNKVTKNN